MVTGKPKVSSYVLVPDNCEMQCTFTGIDRDIEVVLGPSHDGFELVFGRTGLERLIRIAEEALAVPVPDNPRASMPTVHSPR